MGQFKTNQVRLVQKKDTKINPAKQKVNQKNVQKSKKHKGREILKKEESKNLGKEIKKKIFTFWNAKNYGG